MIIVWMLLGILLGDIRKEARAKGITEGSR
jgi:hypothetical protein